MERTKGAGSGRRIGVVAPSTPVTPAVLDRLAALAATVAPDAVLVVDPQCLAVDGHFAGDDDARAGALLVMMARPDIDAVWFAKGGYGAGRIMRRVVADAPSAAGDKQYLGYSDAGMLLGALARAGIGRQAHGSMPGDLAFPDRAEAVARSLRWLAHNDAGSIEPGARAGGPVAAFNLVTLSMLAGTTMMPDLRGHVLLVEEVAEHLYAVDRALRHVLESVPGLAGVRLGSISAVPENDRPFGREPEALAIEACAAHGVPYLGRAMIGHDGGNHVVPLGGAGAMVAVTGRAG